MDEFATIGEFWGLAGAGVIFIAGGLTALWKFKANRDSVQRRWEARMLSHLDEKFSVLRDEIRGLREDQRRSDDRSAKA